MALKALPRTTPASAGVDAAGVIAFVDALESNPDVELHSMMLVRHGQVVAEGWWHPYSAERVHLLYSLSKSFTSAATGFAVAEGLVDLDDTVLSYFPELDRNSTDRRSRSMLVRHVAAMASGHVEETLDRAIALDPRDLVRGFLLIPPDLEPGTVFAYNQPCTFTLAAIVQRVTGQSLSDYLRPRLFDPLGIGETGWSRDASGREIGYSGLYATTEAVATLGQLHLQGGRWGEQQLLPADWVSEATRSHIASTGENPDWQVGYGFQFWMARHGYRGDGAFGQFCVVLPEWDAVLAITGQSPDMQAVLDAVWEHLLPALREAPLTPNDADPALAARLASLALPAVAGVPAPVGSTDQVFVAATGNDQPSLTEVVLSAGSGGSWTVTLVEGVARIGAALGIGKWTVTDIIAASGGWSDADDGSNIRDLRIDLAFLDTPHRLQLYCRPGPGTFECRWVTAPLWPASLSQLRRPGPPSGSGEAGTISGQPAPPPRNASTPFA